MSYSHEEMNKQNGVLTYGDGAMGRTNASAKGESTKKELCDYLNKLARKLHIEKSPMFPNGYHATVDNIGK